MHMKGEERAKINCRGLAGGITIALFITLVCTIMWVILESKGKVDEDDSKILASGIRVLSAFLGVIVANGKCRGVAAGLLLGAIYFTILSLAACICFECALIEQLEGGVHVGIGVLAALGLRLFGAGRKQSKKLRMRSC